MALQHGDFIKPLEYLGAGAVGAAGQQLLNWALPGADPNPLVTGLLTAPAIRGAALGKLDGDAERLLWASSLYSMGAGLAANTVNTGVQVFGSSPVVDPNLAGGLVGAGALAYHGFPLIARLVGKRRAREETNSREPWD